MRFCIGLFILIAILSPTLNLLFKDKNFALSFWDYQLDSGMEKNIQDQGKALNNKLFQPEQALIQSKLQGQIDAISSLVPGVNDVQSQVETAADGTVKKITLRIDANQASRIQEVAGVKVFSNQPEKLNQAEEEVIAGKIVQLISNLYEIPSENVKINFEGG